MTPERLAELRNLANILREYCSTSPGKDPLWDDVVTLADAFLDRAAEVERLERHRDMLLVKMADIAGTEREEAWYGICHAKGMISGLSEFVADARERLAKEERP